MSTDDYTQDFFTDRRNYGDGNVRIGQMDRLWYDPKTNTIRVGDGNPGGRIINAGSSLASNVKIYDEGNLLTNNVSSINFTGNSIVGNVTGNDVTITILNSYASFYSGAFTTLTQGINSNSTDPILVVSTSGFPDSGYIRIDTEVIKYIGKTATSFTGITRGVAGSNNSAHDLADSVGDALVTTAETPANLIIKSTTIAKNIDLNPNSGVITITQAGVYNFQFSIQTECFGNAQDDTAIWFVKNGQIVPATASYGTVPAIHAGVPGGAIITVNIFLNCAANDEIQLQWTSILGTSVITTIPPKNVNIPASPGVIFTVNQIS